MKSYEIMTIANISLGDDGATKLSNSVKDLISSNKGRIIDNTFWGKRKLAYEIKHNKEAFYDVIKFEMDGKELPKLRTKLNLVNGLVRYLVTAS